MPSVANIVGTDMSVYKIVKKNQFACNRMHVGSDYRLPVSMSKTDEEFMVSPAYDVFEIINTDILYPEYLMMWFSRREFDRNAWFYTDADVRGWFGWKALCDMQLPIPSIAKQKEIVKEYNVIQNRIALNQQLIQKLEETAQAIYKQWFVDFEFPDENGNPYKSNDGEMVFNKELEGEIPLGWGVKTISDIGSVKAGGDRPQVYSQTKTNNCQIPIYSNGITDNGLYGFTNKYNYPKDSITISARGTIGFCVLRRKDFDAIVRLLVLIPNSPKSAIYLWQTIKKIEFDNSGSVQNQLTIPQISVLSILFPSKEMLIKYDAIVSLIYQNIEFVSEENQKLSDMKNLLLSKLATIEN
jgi:type I restriction enzyme S subunit